MDEADQSEHHKITGNDLFSNLGIDSIDMIMSNFQEPYNFNISTEIEGLN